MRVQGAREQERGEEGARAMERGGRGAARGGRVGGGGGSIGGGGGDRGLEKEKDDNCFVSRDSDHTLKRVHIL